MTKNSKLLQSRVDAKKQRQMLFLQALAQGVTVAAASEAAGVHQGTAERWVRDDEEFRRARDDIRMAQARAKIDGSQEAGEEVELDGTFITFRQAMFGMDTYWHQREIVRAIEDAPRMEITLVNVPVEHGKTTLLVDYVCYRIANDPNIRVTYVSEGQDLARKVVSQIKNRMTRVDMYPDFITRFGPFHVPGDDSDRKWAADAFTVSKAQHDEKDFTLESRGWKSAIAGSRSDLMLIDDVQSLRSEKQTDKMLATIRQDFLTRVGKDGKVVVVGTRVKEGDIYQALLDEDLVAEYVGLPAVDEDGEPLCPEMWDKVSLAVRRKQVGEEVWARTYQQRPEDSADKTFTSDLVKRCKRASLTIGGFTISGRNVAEGKTKIAMIDPALGGMCSLHVAAFNDDDFILMDTWNKEGLARTEQILEMVENAAVLYAPSLLIVEINALQRGIARDDRLVELSRKHGFRIVEHETGNNKTDPSYGIAQMATDFRTGSVWIPDGDDVSTAKFRPVVSQLLRWRPDVPTRSLQQDCVMALWFGWLEWDARRQTRRTGGSSAWKRGSVHDLLQFETKKKAYA